MEELLRYFMKQTDERLASIEGKQDTMSGDLADLKASKMFFLRDAAKQAAVISGVISAIVGGVFSLAVAFLSK